MYAGMYAFASSVFISSKDTNILKQPIKQKVKELILDKRRKVNKQCLLHTPCKEEQNVTEGQTDRQHQNSIPRLPQTQL